MIVGKRHSIRSKNREEFYIPRICPKGICLPGNRLHAPALCVGELIVHHHHIHVLHLREQILRKAVIDAIRLPVHILHRIPVVGKIDVARKAEHDLSILSGLFPVYILQPVLLKTTVPAIHQPQYMDGAAGNVIPDFRILRSIQNGTRDPHYLLISVSGSQPHQKRIIDCISCDKFLRRTL